MKTVDVFREKMAKGEMVLGMGAWDVMSAKIVQKAGFDMVWLQSFQHSFGWGVPDMGVVTPSELLALTWKVTGEVSIPVGIDFSTGFGDTEHAAYWVREFERAGAAALHVDDKEYEKCPFLPGPEIPRVPVERFVGKLRAMLESRKEGIVVVSRTSLFGGQREEGIQRLKAYKEAGADTLFVGEARDRDDMKFLRSELAGPLMVQINPAPPVTGWGTPLSDAFANASFDELYQLGFRIFNFWGAFSIAYRAALDALQEIKRVGSTRVVWDRLLDWATVEELAGYGKVVELKQKYG